jgi:hypothetical protein
VDCGRLQAFCDYSTTTTTAAATTTTTTTTTATVWYFILPRLGDFVQDMGYFIQTLAIPSHRNCKGDHRRGVYFCSDWNRENLQRGRYF